MKAWDLYPSTKGAFGMFDSVEIIPAGQHSGTLVADLEGAAARVRDRNARICRRCYKPYGDHTAALSMCPWPNPRMTKFSEIACQATPGRGEDVSPCGRPCIPGKEYCAEHYVE